MIGPRGENLIVLMSQPRSGSTLLQRILGAHSDIHTTAEPWLLLPVFATPGEYGTELAEQAISEFRSGFSSSSSDTPLKLYNSALEGTGKARFLDKTPRYYLILSDIQKNFPEAKIIALRRHPLAVLSSIIETWTKDNWEALFQFRNDLLLAPRVLGAQIPGTIGVQYEHLVGEPEFVIRYLSKLLGVSYEPETIQYGNFPKPRGSFGDPITVNQFDRPKVFRVDRWRETLAVNPRARYFASRYVRHFLNLGNSHILGYSISDMLHALGSSVEPTPGWVEHADRFFPIILQ